jgi:hypothetical protein
MDDEIHLRYDDVEVLAENLDRLDLPTGQKALLSAIVAVAAEAVAGPDQPVQVKVSPPFSDQLATAFTPGRVDALDDKVTLSIGRTD